MDWLSIKTAVDTIGLSRDALHLLTGFGLHVALVLIFRSRFSALWPLGLILLGALANEWLDLTLDPWPGDERVLQWWESVKDVIATIAFPVMLVMLTRLVPGRFLRRSADL